MSIHLIDCPACGCGKYAYHDKCIDYEKIDNEEKTE